MVESGRLRLATLACNLFTYRRPVTNKLWVEVQLTASALFAILSAAMAERSLVVDVARLVKVSRVSR